MYFNTFSKVAELLESPLGVFDFVVYLIIAACFLVIVLSIVFDFSEFDKNDKTKDKKRSFVTTGTMFLFFIIFYLLIRFGIGAVEINNFYLKLFLSLVGILVIVAGTLFNIKGRLDLGKNWANQIKIYQDHTLVANGVYKIVRHPLYASLIWIFFGASLVYLNYGAFLADMLIFIPFMYHRAKQEEGLLEKEFPEYKNYKLKTGMFFPKI